MVSSFNLKTEWGKSIVEGINSVFPMDQYSINYIGLGDAQGQGTMTEDECFEIINKKIKNAHFDAVVAFDPLAVGIIEKKIDLFPEDINVVLANATSNTFGRLTRTKNVFVSQMHLAVEDNINLGMKLFPNIKRMVVFSDNSEDGLWGEASIKEVVERMKKKGADGSGETESNIKDIEITYINGEEYSSKEALEKLKEVAAEPTFVLFYLWSSPKDVNPEPLEVMVEAVSRIVDKNIIAFFDDTPNHIVGGYMLSGIQYATFIGQKTKEILASEPHTIDFSEVERLPALNINWNTFTEKGLNMGMLPATTTFYHVKQGFWEIIDYRYVSGALLAIIALMVTVVILSYLALISSKRNSVFFKNMPSDIFVFFSDGKICYSYCKDPQSKKIKSVFEFGAEFEESYKNNLAEINKGSQVSIEYTYKGLRQKSLVARIPQGFFGETTYIVTTVDISDLENAKRNFQELALRMRTTLASIGDAVITADKDGSITFTNQVAKKLLGVGDEIIGKNLDDVYKVFYYTDNTPLAAPSKRVLMGEEENLLTNSRYFTSKNGKLHHVSDTVSPIVMDGESLGSILVFKDVTNEYRQREEITIKNRFLENATNVANISYFRCDENLEPIGGFPKGFLGVEDISKINSPLDILPDSERKDMLSKWREFLKSDLAEFNDQRYTDYFGDRKYFDVYVTASGTVDREFFVVVQDVTKAKENERIISDTNRMLNTLIDNFPCAVFVKNFSAGGRYILHNRYFAEQVGHPNQSFLGKKSADLFPEEEAHTFDLEEAIIVKSGDTLDGIKTSMQADGSMLLNRVVKKSITMENGDVYIMGVAIDMTDYINNKNNLELYASQQRVINECLNFAIKSTSIEDSIEKIMELLGKTMNTDRAFMFVFDENSREFLNKHHWNSEAFQEKPFEMLEMPNQIGNPLIEKISKGEIITFSKDKYEESGPLPTFEICI